MVNDLNRSTLMGHLGADAKQASNPNEKTPVTFSLATAARWVDDQGNKCSRTEWHNIAIFGGLRKYALTLKKGDRVYVEGQLRYNKYSKTVGGETISIVGAQIVAQQIDRVTAKAVEESADFGPSDATANELPPF